MAYMYGRYRRWCTVCERAMALYMRIGMVCYGVCGYGAIACVGTVCRRWVYVWLACVCVGCVYGVRCVCRYIDVVSV